ncbi:MAG: hypothetical protein BGO26_10085 [Actinobacteria bacterium 69-20]|nr:hypothetical protein [Actinomycetota bacterium]OJV23247.1 MAG: hypothetical protein BGO26_10085 [Actinobacteria bacterium 69-20]
MSTLSDLLASRLPEGWSGRRVSREATKRGLTLSPASANNYLNGRHGEPSESVLEAFAAVLTIPIEALREASGLPHGSGPYTPPAEAARLSRRQRLAVDELIRSIVTAQEVGNEAQEPRSEAGGASEQSEAAIADELQGRKDLFIEGYMAARGVDATPGDDSATDSPPVRSAGRAVSERADIPTERKRRTKGA